MDWPEWRTTLISPARTASGDLTEIVVGLAVSPRLPSTIVMRISDGKPVRLDRQAALEHIANVRKIVEAKRRSDGEL